MEGENEKIYKFDEKKSEKTEKLAELVIVNDEIEKVENKAAEILRKMEVTPEDQKILDLLRALKEKKNNLFKEIDFLNKESDVQ